MSLSRGLAFRSTTPLLQRLIIGPFSRSAPIPLQRRHESTSAFWPPNPVDTKASATLEPTTDELEPESAEFSPLPYFVPRTASNNLTVYLNKLAENGHYIRIQRVHGSLRALANDLTYTLGHNPKYVVENPLTRSVVIKRANQNDRLKIISFLEKKGY